MNPPAEDMQRSGDRATIISKRCKVLGLFSLLVGALSGPLVAAAFFATTGASHANSILPWSTFAAIAAFQSVSLFYINLQRTPVKGNGLAMAGLGVTCLWVLVLLALLLRAVSSMRWHCD